MKIPHYVQMSTKWKQLFLVPHVNNRWTYAGCRSYFYSKETSGWWFWMLQQEWEIKELDKLKYFPK